uniref:Uncharacterized protein n=1 Tax=Siphoviridae sp. ctAUQ2 TaxID=2826182 RepID=A0A8S5MZY2_9CAUD|nr:MAG TPA: hypothetical protein [Siphoviridae sp. ctAUQ2]
MFRYHLQTLLCGIKTTCFCCLTLQRYGKYLKYANILATFFEKIMLKNVTH